MTGRTATLQNGTPGMEIKTEGMTAPGEVTKIVAEIHPGMIASGKGTERARMVAMGMIGTRVEIALEGTYHPPTPHEGQ